MLIFIRAGILVCVVAVGDRGRVFWDEFWAGRRQYLQLGWRFFGGDGGSGGGGFRIGGKSCCEAGLGLLLGGCEGGLTQFEDAVGRDGCISVVVANGVEMSVGVGGASNR